GHFCGSMPGFLYGTRGRRLSHCMVASPRPFLPLLRPRYQAITWASVSNWFPQGNSYPFSIEKALQGPAQTLQHPGLGQVDRVRRCLQVCRDVGGALALDDGAPERLPGGLLELNPHLCHSAV